MYELIKNIYYKVSQKFNPNKSDFFSGFILHQIFHQGDFLSYTTSSLRLRGLACILNDLNVNQRKNTLEFGSGISTVLMARLIKLNKLQSKIVSIDQDQNWIDYLKSILIKEELLEFVDFIHSPLVKDENENWGYDKSIIKNQINNITFDLIVIDGPTSNSKEKKSARSSNSELFLNQLDKNFSIFIDNTDRKEERVLAKSIGEKVGAQVITLDSNFSIIVKGNHFNFII